jgi:D-aminopeptidase
VAVPLAETRMRARALGLRPGRFATGLHNAITDVEGVAVGHCTLIEGEGTLVRGQGPVRTGVTAILPVPDDVYHERVMAGSFVLNGAGEVMGLTQIAEWGLIETPILLTNTLSVAGVADAVITHMLERAPSMGRTTDVVIPVVGECDDSWLNDAAGRHVKAEHVFAALADAQTGPVAEGCVGAGTGMITCDFAGGIGNASRIVPVGDAQYTMGVLVLSNFGHRADLSVCGHAVGALLTDTRSETEKRKAYGSLIAVLATDAPLLQPQLNRLCKRVALGIGRAGSSAAHGSGEIAIAFSTMNRVPRNPRSTVTEYKILYDTALDPLFQAAVEATEEAILNAMCMGTAQHGVDGHACPALPLGVLKRLAFAPRLEALTLDTEPSGSHHNMFAAEGIRRAVED